MQTTIISAAPRLGLAALLLLAAAPAVQAQTYTLNTLANFNSAEGNAPDGVLTLSADGSTLYGVTNNGGANGDRGTVFSVPVSGGAPTDLLSFNGTDGAHPAAGLTLSADGRTLYGTTSDGGVNGGGTVFSVPTSGGMPTILTSFDASAGSSAFAGPLTLSGSTLYGTTSSGGADGYGTVFSLPVVGGTPTTLVTFSGANGEYPTGGLTQIGTTLYGTTQYGSVFGTNNEGEVFSVPVSGGTPTVLAGFNSMGGAVPQGRLKLSADGSTFYGTTEFGDNGQGEVFSVPVGGGAPTVLALIGGDGGGSPTGDLTLVGSTLYGTTLGSFGTHDGIGVDPGAVFSVPTGGGAPTVLAKFNGTDGAHPAAGLTLGADGIFYGTTSSGGAFNDGTVFSLTPNAAPVPEASSWVSFGLLLLGGLGGVVLRTRRRKSQG